MVPFRFHAQTQAQGVRSTNHDDTHDSLMLKLSNLREKDPMLFDSNEDF